MENGNLKELIALDVDSSDNITEDTLFKFVQSYGSQLQGFKHGNWPVQDTFDLILYKFKGWSYPEWST